MKRQINITIKDIDDIQKVLEALDILLKTIIHHYIKKDDISSLTKLVLSCSVYFGTLIRLMGYNEDDFNDE